MKTARFSQVVDQCGAPETYTLWTDPKKDAQFQRALRQRRIMMVHQENVGTAADFGVVGFDGKVAGELLVFPKSLKRFEGMKIVGVKYELLDGANRRSKADENAAVRKGKEEPPAHPQRKKPVGSETPDRETKIVPFTPQAEEHPKREKLRKSSKPPKAKALEKPKTKPKPGVSSAMKEAAEPVSPVGSEKAEVAISHIRKKLQLAMKALQAGKAVQSYQMLEQLDRELSSS